MAQSAEAKPRDKNRKGVDQLSGSSERSVVRITKENKPRRRPETADNHIVKNCIKRRL